MNVYYRMVSAAGLRGELFSLAHELDGVGMCAVPLPVGSKNYLLARGCVEHWGWKECAIVETIRRHLAPDGEVVIAYTPLGSCRMVTMKVTHGSVDKAEGAQGLPFTEREFLMEAGAERWGWSPGPEALRKDRQDNGGRHLRVVSN